MPLWDRFTRMVRSNVGRLLDDPVDKSGAGKRLDQRMKELRARDGELKALDEKLITLKGQATFLERKLDKLRLREAELVAKVKAAENHNSTVAAASHEVDLHEAQREMAAIEAQLVGARSGVELAEATKRALIEEKATRLAAAQEALLEAERDPMFGAGGPVMPGLSQGEPPPQYSAPGARPASPEARPAPATLRPDPEARLPRDLPPAPAPAAEPASSAPRIKITPRGGASEPDQPRKTIGPEPANALRPAEEPGSGVFSKTLGPAEGDPMSKRAAEPEPRSTSGKQQLGPTAGTPTTAETPTAPATKARSSDQLLDELERLGKLLEAGAISAEEFAAAKKKLL